MQHGVQQAIAHPMPAAIGSPGPRTATTVPTGVAPCPAHGSSVSRAATRPKAYGTTGARREAMPQLDSGWGGESGPGPVVPSFSSAARQCLPRRPEDPVGQLLLCTSLRPLCWQRSGGKPPGGRGKAANGAQREVLMFGWTSKGFCRGSEPHRSLSRSAHTDQSLRRPLVEPRLGAAETMTQYGAQCSGNSPHLGFWCRGERVGLEQG